MTATMIYIRNNGMGIRNIGDKMLLPGEAKAFTPEELEPFKGSKDLEIAFSRGTLSVVSEAGSVDLLFPQQGKPDESKIPGSGSALAGDPNAVTVKDAEALAAFVRSNPPASPVGTPVPAPVAQ